MDIVKLLAPFASRNLRSSRQFNPGPYNLQSIAISTRPVQFTSTAAINPNNLEQTNKPRAPPVVVEGNRNRFTAYHKKSNLHFGRDAKALAHIRKLNFQENIKEKRSHAMNINRGISDNVICELSKNVTGKQMNSRSEQLKRWKMEKLELLKNSTTSKSAIGRQINTRKEPLHLKKEGLSSIPIPPEPSAFQSKKFGSIQNPRGFPCGMTTRSRSTLALQENKSGNNSRTITVGHRKAMATSTGSVLQENKLGNILPAKTVSFEMTQNKGVALQDKNSKNILLPGAFPFQVTTRSRTGAVVLQGNILETVLLSKSTPSMNTHSHDGIVREDNDSENIPPPNQISSELNFQIKRTVVHSPAFKNAFAHSPTIKKLNAHSPAIKKPIAHSPAFKKVTKPKGMQFDSVYKEFNEKFMVECTILSDYSHKWVKILSDKAEEIPEDEICEIESSVGQAKLLLELKLPQFAELLYFYLSRTLNPHPVLPCDLDGWWEVALISIEKVKDRFVKLEKLSSNEWKREKRVGKVSKQQAWLS